jgi:hypothetical protein
LVKIRRKVLSQIRSHAGGKPKCSPVAGLSDQSEQKMLSYCFMREPERRDRLKYNRLDRSRLRLRS